MSRKIVLSEAQERVLRLFYDTETWFDEQRLVDHKYALKSLSKKGAIESRLQRNGWLEYRMTKRGLASL